MKDSMSLSETLESAGKFIAKKVILPLAVVGASYFLATQDANAQDKKKYPKGHDYGAYFTVDKSGNKWNLEEKVFYGQRYFVQRTEKTKDNELGLIFYDAHKVKVKLDGETKKPIELKADEEIVYQPVGNKLKLSQKGLYAVRAGGLCDIQVAEKTGVSKSKAGYIVTDNVKDFLPDLETVVINGIEYYWPMVAAEKLNEPGKTNNYLAIQDSIDFEIDYNTKDISLVDGKIYRGISQKLETEKIIKINPGEGIEVSNEPLEAKVKGKEAVAEDSTAKKKDLYLIFGAEGNQDYAAGKLGVRGNHLGLTLNGGPLFNSVEKITTPVSPYTGRYGEMTTETKGSVIGGALELYIGKNWELYGGVGVNYWNINEKTADNIMKDGQIIDPESNSRIYHELSEKAYGGISTPLGKNKNVKLRIGAGYDTEKGIIGDIGINFNILKN